MAAQFLEQEGQMHIEPGILNAAKVLSANIGALGTLGIYVVPLVRRPAMIVKTILAAAFFSVFMEIFHMPVGASELHFIGASAVYFTFGFLPTLFGFAIGLLAQGFFFEPQDLVHLGVNSLSLMLPLVAAHGLLGRHLSDANSKAKVNWLSVVKFDGMYYGGVVVMVGFWLSMGEEPTPLYNWAIFAASYVPLVLCEPIFTCLVLRALKRYEATPVVQKLTGVSQLNLA